MKTKGVFIRILVVPFLFAMNFITSIFGAFLTSYYFLVYGGEWYTYKTKDEKKAIWEIYHLLYEKHKKENL